MKVSLTPFTMLAKDVTASYNKLPTDAYRKEGKVMIIDQGKAGVAGYTDDESLAVSPSTPVIVFGDHTQCFKFVDRPFVLGADGAKVLQVNTKVVDPLYFFHLVRTATFPDKGYSRYFKYLKKQSFLVPADLRYQHSIATLLSRAEGLIAQRKESLRLLDELVRSVFLEMFGDPVRNEKGWKTEPFGKVVQILGGGTPSKGVEEYWSGSISWATSKDVKEDILFNTIDHVSQAGLDNSPSRLVPEDTVLVVVKSKILMHRLPVALTGVPMCFNQDLKALVPDKRLHPYVLFQLVRLFEPVLLRQARGVNTEGLTNAHWRRLRIPLIPEERQMEFVDVWRRLQGLKKNVAKSLFELEHLYGSLSQRAFRGELELGGKPGPSGNGSHESVIIPGGNAGTGPSRPPRSMDYRRVNVAHGKAPPTDKAAPDLDFDLLGYLLHFDDRLHRPFRFEELLEEAARRSVKANSKQLKDLVYRALEAEPPLLKQVIVNTEVRTQDGFETVGQMHLQYIG